MLHYTSFNINDYYVYIKLENKFINYTNISSLLSDDKYHMLTFNLTISDNLEIKFQKKRYVKCTVILIDQI